MYMGWFDFLKSNRKEIEQIEEDTIYLHDQLHGALDKDETMRLLLEAKGLLVIAEDRSEKRLVDYILRRAEGKLDLNEAKIIYKFITDIRTTGS
jgi:hypothetical protein